MRTQPYFRRLNRFITVALLLACTATGGFGQEATKETSATRKNDPFATARSTAYDLEIKDSILIWNGGKQKANANLASVVDLLRELHPEANFVVSPGLQGIDFADLKLRTSSVEEKLEAIRVAGGLQFLWRPIRQSGTANEPGKTLYVVDALPESTKPSLQVEAFNIGGYLDSFGTNESKEARQKLIADQVEQIQQMVAETVKEYQTISLTSNSSRSKSLRTPSIRFHPGANLVIIIGEPEPVAVAAKVVGALPGAQRSVANAFGDDDSFHQKFFDANKRPQRDLTLPASRR